VGARREPFSERVPEGPRRGERFRDLADTAPAILWLTEPDGSCSFLSRRWFERTGQEEAGALGHGWIDAVHPDDRESCARIFREANERRVPFAIDYRLRSADGTYRWTLDSAQPRFGGGGEFLGFAGSVVDIHERKQAEFELRAITDALPVLVSLVDETCRYRFVSATYERWFGRARRDLVGKTMEDVLGREAFAGIRGHVERALRGEHVRYETVMPYRHGPARHVEASYVPQRDERGRVTSFVALVSDITERKGLERYRDQAAATGDKLLRITTAIANAVTTDEVFAALVDDLAVAVGALRAALFLVDEDGHGARLVRAHAYSEEQRTRYAHVPLDGASLPLSDAIRTGQPQFFPTRDLLFARHPHLAASIDGPLGIVCLPLSARGRVLGALALTTTEDEPDRALLSLVATSASQALERLRLFDAERRARSEATAAVQRLTILNHASRAFAESSLDLDARLGAIAHEIGVAFASAVTVFLERDGDLTPAASYDRGAGPGAASDVAERVRAKGESLLLAAPAAVVGAPLRVGGRLIGVVLARGTAPFGTDDLRLFEELAERAAVAIENGHLYETARREQVRAENLYRFAQVVVAAQDVETVYEAALDAIEVALGAPRSAVLTFDDDGRLRFRAWRTLSDAYRSAVEGHSPWPHDARRAEPILVPDVTEDAALASRRDVLAREGIAALAFFPLFADGRLLGELMLYFGAPHRLATKEVETAATIANHLASVVLRFLAVSKLEDTIRSNERFAGVLAHDLRNPLDAIMTGARVLAMQREAAEARPLERIVSSGERMRVMIEQLLDFTRARTGGGIAVQPRAANLAEICARAIEELEIAHPDWIVRQALDGDTRGTWDPDRLLQVVSNLVANAGHHGRAGSVFVDVDGAAPDAVVLAVHNEGAIPASLLDELFDPFRGTRQGSRGVGLGLFIVREIVRAHGGSVDVRSSDAAGTTFTVRLPRVRA